MSDSNLIPKLYWGEEKKSILRINTSLDQDLRDWYWEEEKNNKAKAK